VIYRAQQKNTKRAVAIKTLVVSQLDDWARRAFVEAAQRASKLVSPAFIKIYDHYLEKSPELVVSEFVEGEPLHRVLQSNPRGLPLARVKSILLDLSEAIEEAHACRWRRGEMCPSDILIEKSGQARISPIDFSNLLREEMQVKGEHLVEWESLTYMTPERYFGQEPSLLTDQYSLGLIAVDLLGGPRIPRIVRPCDLQAKPGLFADLQAGKGKWAHRSAHFTGVVCRMLRIDPEERWPSISEVRGLLKEIEDAEFPEERARKIAMASYAGLQANGIEGERQFYGCFYRNLFAALPEAQSHFGSIDMNRHYGMLNRAIHTLLKFDPQSDNARADMMQIAARHARLNLTRHHYAMFLHALLKTVEECFEKDSVRLAAWRIALQPGIDFLRKCEEEQRAASALAAQSRASGPSQTEQSAFPRPQRALRRYLEPGVLPEGAQLVTSGG
jgi:hemoglobin-like flavoprotein